MLRRYTIRINAVYAILIALLVVIGSMTVNSGYSYFMNKKVRAEKAKQQEKNPYSIFIDVDENRIYLLKNGKLFKSYSCATGKKKTPSPLGSFKIVKKSLWGEGFGGFYMGLDCPWGQYGIHGTTTPASVGSDSSHGCFRMFNSDVEELYGYVPVGTPVVIAKGCYGAFGNGIRTLRPGMYGRDVMFVQQRLKDLGFYNGVCNGRYSASGFIAAIHKFQKAMGLPVSDSVSKNMYELLGFRQIE